MSRRGQREEEKEEGHSFTLGSLGLLIYVVGIPKGPCGRPPFLSPHRIPTESGLNWSLRRQDVSVGKLLAVQARWPEF